MRRALLVQALALAIVGCTVVYEPAPQTGAQQVQYQQVIRVPDIVGMQRTDAERIMTSIGLRLDLERQHSDRPADIVLTQSPAAGSNVQRDSSIKIVISAGRPLATVPNVVGMNPVEAGRTLAGAGLATGRITMPKAAAADPVVVSQSPAAGERTETGQAVDLVVGPRHAEATYIVPPVQGLHLRDAIEAITKAGLQVGAVSTGPSETVGIGSVSAQSPASGQRVAKDAVVSLVVSTGPQAQQTEQVIVPNVIGMAQDAAVAALNRAGLRVQPSAQPHAGPETGVLAQNPRAGQLTNRGSIVTITVARPPAKDAVIVTDVSGWETARAVAALNQAGLMAATEEVDGPKDRVVRQAPGAGERVARGSTVTLYVGKGDPAPPRVQRRVVPNMVGTQLEVARQRIAASEMAVGEVTYETGEPGQVLRQTPAARTITDVGTAIDLVVGQAPPPPPPPRVQRRVVPNVVGMQLDAARERIVASQMAVGEVAYETGEPGQVLRQTPAARTMADVGTAIELVVGQAAPPPPPPRAQRRVVPNVVGMQLGAAQERVVASGLTVGEVTYETGEPGQVLRQSPAARGMVEAGTAVNLAVGRAADLVQVPNMVDRPIGLVRVALQDAGLVLGEITYVESDRQQRVVSHDPAAGAMVERGSVVNVQMGRRTPPGRR